MRGANVEAPKKLYLAVRMALWDLLLVEQRPSEYVVSMGNWHAPMYEADIGPTDTSRCHVCLAGSVMAMTHHIDPSVDLDSTDFEEEWTTVFNCLDNIRTSSVLEAIDDFYGARSDLIPVEIEREADELWESGRYRYSYNNNRRLWLEHMVAIADWLQEKDL